MEEWPAGHVVEGWPAGMNINASSTTPYYTNDEQCTRTRTSSYSKSSWPAGHVVEVTMF